MTFPNLSRKDAGSLTKRAFDLDLKRVKDDGTFAGYASVFGVVDSYNEIVAPGAFKASLAERADKDRKVPVLWQHLTSEPIGVYTALREDDHGLFVEGRLILSVARAKEALDLLEAGAVSGLSIGYYVREASRDEKTGIRTLIRLDLQEVSLVTFPANDEARIIRADEIGSARELERLLSAGTRFSRSAAKAVARRGWQGLSGRRDLSDDQLKRAAARVLRAAQEL